MSVRDWFPPTDEPRFVVLPESPVPEALWASVFMAEPFRLPSIISDSYECEMVMAERRAHVQAVRARALAEAEEWNKFWADFNARVRAPRPLDGLSVEERRQARAERRRAAEERALVYRQRKQAKRAALLALFEDEDQLTHR